MSGALTRSPRPAALVPANQAPARPSHMATGADSAAFADQRALALAQRSLAGLVAGSPRVLAQRARIEAVQRSARPVAQAAAQADQASAAPVPGALPQQLKRGIEHLSGMAMDHVQVHYNSARPAQLQAHAYAQGAHIHLGPGQEKHLPHEAWHVVQQAQGRVRPTLQMKNGPMLNDQPALEAEADRMGVRAATHGGAGAALGGVLQRAALLPGGAGVVQAVTQVQHVAGAIAPGPGQANQRVGKSMTAQLDAADPVVGSATGGQWIWTRALRNRFRQAGVVRGHLLNHDLGGEAIPANLYPISTNANSAHSAQVEQPVKQLMHDAAAYLTQHYGGPALNVANNYVHYRVNVIEAIPGDPSNAYFQCTFWHGAGMPRHINIPSSLPLDRDRYTPNAGVAPGMLKVLPLAAWAHGVHRNTDHTIKPANQQKIQVNDPHAHLPNPAFAMGPQQNHANLLESLLIFNRDKVAGAKYTTAYATYSIENDAVRQYLLSLQSFLDDLEDAGSGVMSAADFGQVLRDAVQAAAQVVTAEKLPARSQRPAFKQAFDNAVLDALSGPVRLSTLLNIATAVRAGQFAAATPSAVRSAVKKMIGQGVIGTSGNRYFLVARMGLGGRAGGGRKNKPAGRAPPGKRKAGKRRPGLK